MSELFTPEQRQIYKYEDAGVERWADPIAVRLAIRKNCGCEPDELAEKAEKLTIPGIPQADFEESLAAKAKLLAAVVQAFGILAFDPATAKGWTEEELHVLYNHFCGWLQKKNQTQGSSPTLPSSSPAS